MGLKCSTSEVWTKRKLRTGGGVDPPNTRSIPPGKDIVSSPEMRIPDLEQSTVFITAKNKMLISVLLVNPLVNSCFYDMDLTFAIAGV